MKEPATLIKYDYLNAVRGVAIILVVVIHVGQLIPNLPPLLFKLAPRGGYGVQLFFIASAITIFLSYSRRVVSDGADAKKKFFIRRFFRITPMYYLAAIFYCFYYYYHPEFFQQSFNVLKVIPSLLYINGFFLGAINYIPPGGWSVGVEMAFYCFVPFIFSKVSNLKSALWMFVILLLANQAVKFAARFVSVYILHVNYHSLEDWSLYFWFPNQVVIFSLGIILFYIIPLFNFKNTLLGNLAVLGLIAMLTGIFLLKDKYDSLYLIPEHIVAAMIFSAIILTMSKVSVPWLDNKFTRELGKVSFSLYLIHFVIIRLVLQYLPSFGDPTLDFFATLTAVVVIGGLVSSITYRYIEQKGIALGESLIKKYFNSNAHAGKIR